MSRNQRRGRSRVPVDDESAESSFDEEFEENIQVGKKVRRMSESLDDGNAHRKPKQISKQKSGTSVDRRREIPSEHADIQKRTVICLILDQKCFWCRLLG